MKKLVLGIVICSLLLMGCSKTNETKTKSDANKKIWNLETMSAKTNSDSEYVTTMFNEHIKCNGEQIKFENPNNFAIYLELTNYDKKISESYDTEEYSIDIEPNGKYNWTKAKKGTTYEIGVHADVKENTVIKLKAISK